jgi:uncharacterized protein (DUF58 family)
MNRSVWVTFVVGLALISGLSGSWTGAWLALSAAALVIYSAIAFRKPAQLLSAHRRVATGNVAPGEAVIVHLGIAWQGLRAPGWVVARDEVCTGLKALDPPGRLFVASGSRQLTLSYRLQGESRGYFPVGPTAVSCGDFFGAVRSVARRDRVDYLTVTPRVVRTPRVRLPSNRPIGDARSPNRAFEDPSRLAGVRDFQPGDGMRRIHWRASARTGRLASRVLEPSCSTEVNIVLNLHQADYPPDAESLEHDVDLACTTVASLAASLLGDKQAVGLQTNGLDARWAAEGIPPARRRPNRIRPDRNPAQLPDMLELLGRMAPNPADPLPDFLTAVHSHLPWSATLLLVTHGIDERAALALRELRRTGFSIAAIIVGTGDDTVHAEHRAAALRLPMARVKDEDDLETLEIIAPRRR